MKGTWAGHKEKWVRRVKITWNSLRKWNGCKQSGQDISELATVETTTFIGYTEFDFTGAGKGEGEEVCVKVGDAHCKIYTAQIANFERPNAQNNIDVISVDFVTLCDNQLIL